MSKKLKNLKWQSVALEGFSASVTENLQGFVGLEECKNYGFEKDAKRPKKKKPQKKRKSEYAPEKEIPSKKVRLSNGFIVETCNSITPSLANEIRQENDDINEVPNTKNEKSQRKVPNTKENPKAMTKSPKNKNKRKIGEDISQNVSNLTAEDMLTWAEFKLPEPLLKALTELGFKQPTTIQQLTLPAAIHGRRDILGAAETGSGKTLAFGLPILTGIIKMKEKADAGLDFNEITYKKISAKKKQVPQPVKKTIKTRNKKKKELQKESSEDGYSSGEECEIDETETKKDEESESEEIETANEAVGEESDDYIEEIVVPVRKREASTDEGNDSDSDNDNYIHLSDMLDSDDLADNSDDDDKNDSTANGAEIPEEESKSGNDSDEESDSDRESIEKKTDRENNSSEESTEGNSDEGNKSGDESDESEDGNEEEMNEKGIGCVTVIDNVEMPGHLVPKTGRPLYALILSPTRELAIQISNHLKAAAKYTDIRIATIVGGMAAAKQERVLRCGPEVVVATPGRLWELLTQGQPHLQHMDCVKFLAIDETDRMLERGHFEELHSLLERLNSDEARRGSRHNFVFSATLTMVHDLPGHMRGKKVTKSGKIINRKVDKMTPQQKIKRLINLIGMTEPKVVDITQTNLGTAETLTESRIACSLEHKEAYLYYILKRHPGRAIVFCNAINTVKRLTQTFTILKCRPLPLHATMPQKQRLRNLERFRDDPHGVLIATDVAARGLDIPDVDHVIHYQVPRTAENYVHRSGRTARAHKEGLTILMLEPGEAFLYSKLCRTLNRTSEVPLFPVAPQTLSPIRDLVSLARDIEVLELRRRRAAQANGWREKAAREMDMIVDEDDVPTKPVDPAIDKALRVKRRALQSMLSRPLFPKGFSYKYPTLNDPGALEWADADALQVMKKAIESGELKKEKRKSKNAPLLKLQKTFKNKIM